jgi:hypothetical protein
MIDEGIIIEFMKHIKRQLYEEQARADNADHEGRVKDYFWHAGYISALKESLKEIERATGINRCLREGGKNVHDTYTKAELVEKFQELEKREIVRAKRDMELGESAAAEWHLNRASMLKELIALTEKGAL